MTFTAALVVFLIGASVGAVAAWIATGMFYQQKLDRLRQELLDLPSEYPRILF